MRNPRAKKRRTAHVRPQERDASGQGGAKVLLAINSRKTDFCDTQPKY